MWFKTKSPKKSSPESYDLVEYGMVKLEIIVTLALILILASAFGIYVHFNP